MLTDDNVIEKPPAKIDINILPAKTAETTQAIVRTYSVAFDKKVDGFSMFAGILYV